MKEFSHYSLTDRFYRVDRHPHNGSSNGEHYHVINVGKMPGTKRTAFRLENMAPIVASSPQPKA